MRRFIACLFLSSLAACGGTSVPVLVNGSTEALTTAATTLATNPTIAPISVDTGADTSFALLLNNVRVLNKSSPVIHNDQLDAAAQAHAQDMLDNDYFSHTGQNGSTPGDRATLAGYDWRTYGENIASGYRSEASVMKGWTDSPGHHANNINPNFKEFGLGLAQDGGDTRWVLMLGAR